MDIRKQKNSIPTVSLDEPVNEDESMSLMDIIPSEFNIDEYLIKKEQIEKLLKAVITLSKDERKLIDLYYGKELRQQEIAAELNVSQAKISRDIKSIIEKLRMIMINE